jgi:hypothetical protein
VKFVVRGGAGTPDIQIEAEDSLTIDALKATLSQKTGLPQDKMQLVYGGVVLSNGTTVGANNIVHEGQITVAVTLIGGAV